MPPPSPDLAPADSASALAHFEAAFRFETDCWDVHDAISNKRQDFVLVDVLSPDLYAHGHALGRIKIPHCKLIEGLFSRYPRETVFVVYCPGPHCNGAHRGA